MVGLIQKILLDLIQSLLGEEGVLDVKRRADIPLDKNFKINTAYSDEEWQRLWKSSLEILKVTPEKACNLYADAFYKDVMTRFPMWFKMSKNSYEFLARQPAIHNNFATGVRSQKDRQAITDKFLVEVQDKKLITHYRSPNKLCELYIALAKWLIEYYHDSAVIEEVTCMHSNQPECEIHIQWQKFGDTHA